MTGIIKTDQLQGAQSSTITVPSGNNLTVGGTLGVTGAITSTSNITMGAGTEISISGDGGNSGLLLRGNASDVSIVGTHGAQALVLRTNSAERMRIDTSGNVLVGTTNANPAENNVAGIGLLAGNAISVTDDGGAPIQLNRKTSDGSIAIFRKDGSTVGSIGSNSSDLYIGEGTSALRFDGESAFIYPYSISGNAVSDNSITLGSSSYRFKDLYLSSGVFLGGTGTANELTDYEEGSFTPALTVGTITSGDGRFVKIGKQVTVWIYVPIISNTSSSSILEITGLPFTSETGSLMDSTTGSVMCRYIDDGLAEPLSIVTFLNSGDNKVRLYVIPGNQGTYGAVLHNAFNNANVGIRITHTYMTS